MIMFKRLVRHFVASYWHVQRYFPTRTRARITRAIGRAESRHTAQMRFVVEASLTPHQLLHRVSARERALAVFSSLRIWDTAANNGVLIYVLLGDHAVEIIADRGVASQVDQAQTWVPILLQLQQAFAAGQYEAGALGAIDAVATELSRHFPSDGAHPDELPNAITLL